MRRHVNGHCYLRHSFLHLPHHLTPIELVLNQWHSVRVEVVQEQDHENGANKHWYWSEEPEKQVQSKVQCPEPNGPEIAASDNGQLDALRRDAGAWRADQVIGVDEVPGQLDEAWEGEEEADEEADVLDGEGGGPSVTVDKVAREEVVVGVADPSTDQEQRVSETEARNVAAEMTSEKELKFKIAKEETATRLGLHGQVADVAHDQ
ncbi:hypothetical protein NL676_023070 [Syzygium grande]|nr:hypothetical protein NL676_023070 [Syzygium grande]